MLQASTLSHSNEIIYEADIDNNTMKEIQTLYNGKQIIAMQYDSIEKGLHKIEEQSIIPVRNKEDVLEILKDEDKLNSILKQGLSNEEYQKWSNNILDYFRKIGAKLKFDYLFKYDIYKNLAKHRCKHCNQTGNIHVIKGDEWYCKKHVEK